jgi:CubicO group peptidase (beta-lactamase class C family)
LVEQGLVDLDAPAEEYLRAYRLVRAKAGRRRPTLRQLLRITGAVVAVVDRDDRVADDRRPGQRRGHSCPICPGDATDSRRRFEPPDLGT